MATNELYHHGIKGQKWGIRRYQNEDGSYTDAGIKRRNKYYAKADKYERRANSVRGNGIISSFRRNYNSRIADNYRSKITRNAFDEALAATYKYDRNKKQYEKLSKRYNNFDGTVRVPKSVSDKLIRNAKSTLKNEHILQTSINTISRQMDEHTKEKVDKWLKSEVLSQSLEYAEGGGYAAVYVNNRKYAENLRKADYISSQADARRTRS